MTFDEGDFPADVVGRYGLHTRHPDRVLLDVEGLEPGSLIEAARSDRLRYPNRTLSADAYIHGLRRSGLPERQTTFHG